MNVLRLGLLFAWLASTTLVVACDATESEGTPATEAGAGGEHASGGAEASGGANATGGASGGTSSDTGGTGGGASSATGGGASSGGASASAPDAAVNCTERGASCAEPGDACCSGLVCVAWKNPPRSGCEKACGAPGDCESGCCLPLANSNTSFCAAAEACQCAALDAKCGGSARCCAGLECTTFDATGAFACKPACKESKDCASGCCAPLTGTSASVCLGKEWCRK